MTVKKIIGITIALTVVMLMTLYASIQFIV